MCGRRGAAPRFVRQYAAGDPEAHGAAQRKASRTARRGFKRERGAEDLGEYPRQPFRVRKYYIKGKKYIHSRKKRDKRCLLYTSRCV